VGAGSSNIRHRSMNAIVLPTAPSVRRGPTFSMNWSSWNGELATLGDVETAGVCYGLTIRR
jgi:hypothetical protein